MFFDLMICEDPWLRGRTELKAPPGEMPKQQDLWFPGYDLGRTPRALRLYGWDSFGRVGREEGKELGGSTQLPFSLSTNKYQHLPFSSKHNAERLVGKAAAAANSSRIYYAAG